MELISIIMPTYKNEGYTLKRAINSIVIQSYNNWELIIVDDNIEKNFSNIVIDTISNFKDSRIYYYKNQNNLGSAKSRNVGIKKSKGNYITFLDDDDEYLKDKLKSQVQTMIMENADYSIMNLNLYDDLGRLIRTRKHTYLKRVNDKDSLLIMHLKYHLTGTDTFMFKRDYLFKIGLFDEIDMGDEFYLMLKAINNNGKISYIPKSLVRAYIHPNGIGITAGLTKEKGENILYERKKKYFDILDRNDIRYIKMRHYLVLLSCGIRERNYFKIFTNIFRAFFSNPISFIRFGLNRKEY